MMRARVIRRRVQIGLTVIGGSSLLLAWAFGQGVLLGVGVIALVVAVLLQPWVPRPTDDKIITPWEKGSGPL